MSEQAPSATMRRARTPSVAALIHGLGACAIGAAMLSESHAGYRFPVFDGPRMILAFLPDPFTGWGAIFLVLGLAVVVARDGGLGRLALAALAGTWMVYATGALVLGLTSPDAASTGGIAWTLVAADAARAALAYAPHARPGTATAPER